MAGLGLYICHCGTNIAARVDIDRVAAAFKDHPNVSIVRQYPYMCSDPGQELIKKDIHELELEGVVVAACSPRLHETTFRKACVSAGLNPYRFEMANIREQCAWVHDDREESTAKAINLISAALSRAFLLESLETEEVPVTRAALVVGGGIAGIQAALDIAAAGYKVILVEKEPSIGGHMAQLDKTFPTLDCSACILTPKMVEVAEHPNITLLSYATLERVEGFVGNFTVTIRKKARYVNGDTCTGCGLCAEACRMKEKVPDPFNMNLNKRSAIYIPFPQAVPLVYTVDPEYCIFLTKGKCGREPACQSTCGTAAIDFHQKDELIHEEVGAVILATGYEQFDPGRKAEMAYTDYDNVISGLEFERIVSASGPTKGEIQVGETSPKRIVFIHCVGSRDKNIGNEYCSRVCCMYLIKQAHLAREKIPDVEVTMLYVDLRCFGKGYEEFYDRVRGEGVIFRRASGSEIYRQGDRLIVRAEDTLLGKTIEIESDLVVLGTGLEPGQGTDEAARLLKISRSTDGFLMEAHPKLRPVEAATQGIFLAGCCQGPKDIPDTVAQAKAAASSVLALLNRGTVAMEPITAQVDEERCAGCRICQTMCAFDALSFDEADEVMRVNRALCKGCGSCAAACPSGAMSMHHFTDRQIMAQIRALAAWD